MKEVYGYESDTFKAVGENKGIVKYLGEYHFKGVKGQRPRHNIILEYGESDLDEYLAAICPPVLPEEINNFWDGIFKLAYTLRDFHDHEQKYLDGRSDLFKGYV